MHLEAREQKVLYKDHPGGSVEGGDWNGESLEADIISQVILPKEGVTDRGCSKKGQDVGGALDFICTDLSGLICSYRALKTKRYFLCNSFVSKT